MCHCFPSLLHPPFSCSTCDVSPDLSLSGIPPWYHILTFFPHQLALPHFCLQGGSLMVKCLPIQCLPLQHLPLQPQCPPLQYCSLTEWFLPYPIVTSPPALSDIHVSWCNVFPWNVWRQHLMLQHLLIQLCCLTVWNIPQQHSPWHLSMQCCHCTEQHLMVQCWPLMSPSEMLLFAV